MPSGSGGIRPCRRRPPGACGFARWCPGRCLVMVGDGAYASLDVFWTLRERVVCVARWRMDARFFNPPPPRKKGQKGRPRVVGTRQLTWYAMRWAVEVFFPQMTKTDLLTPRAVGQVVTDLHVGVRNDHPVDEQQDELAALFEARLGQAPLHPLSERLQ